MRPLPLMTLVLCTLWLAACGKREAVEVQKREMAIVAGSGTGASAPVLEVAPMPGSAVVSQPPAVAPEQPSPGLADVVRSLPRFEELVATCAPGSSPKQCSESIAATAGPEVAASENLQNLLKTLADCRPDVTAALCGRVVATMVLDLKDMGDAGRAASEPGQVRQ